MKSRESDWTFGDGRFCVQLCIETLCKRATSVAHLTNFSFEFFHETFTEDAPLLFLYYGAKKSKNDQKLKSRGGGPATTTTSPRPGDTRGRWKKICHQQPQKKKGGRKRQCPALCEVCPQTLEPGPSSRFQPPRPFERLPLVLVSQGFGCPTVVQDLSKRVQWWGRELSNSSVIVCGPTVRLVLEVKLYAFALRAMATFKLFDQVSRACPWFSPLQEASGRQGEICACSSVPSPAPSAEISCLQVSAKRPEPLKVSSPLTSSCAYSSALAQVSSIKASERFQGWRREDDEYKPMNLTHSRIPLN